MLFWITPWASAEINPACGAGRARAGFAPGGAGKAVGVIEHVEYRRNDDGAGEDADDQRHCCFDGVASTS